eukprot:362080-Pyramimonas_sp.AAC.1
MIWNTQGLFGSVRGHHESQAARRSRMLSMCAGPGAAALQETHGHEGDRVALQGDLPHHGIFGSFDEGHISTLGHRGHPPHHPSQNATRPTLSSDPGEDPQYSGTCGRF